MPHSVMHRSSDGEDLPPSFWPLRLNKWVDALAKAGAIFVVGFGVVQFLDAKNQARIERTQALMERWAEGPVHDAHTAITAVLRDNLGAIEAYQSAGLNGTAAREAHADLVDYFVWDSNDGTGLAGEIDVMVDFFDIAAVCIRSGLCDETVGRAFLGVEALRFYENFAPYIEQRRRLAPQYADMFEEVFVTNGRPGKSP